MLSFKRHRQINESIPGYKSAGQLNVLADLIRELPWFAKIVELGSCAGRGTWTISKNSPPFSKVYAVDWWSGKKVFKGHGFCLDESESDTQAYFEKHIKDCHNVFPVRGDATGVSIKGEIDCLLLDCDEGKNRNNYEPIWKKWKVQLKPGALVIGANFFPEHRPDEVVFAKKVSEELENFRVEQGLWSGHFKPRHEEGKTLGVNQT